MEKEDKKQINSEKREIKINKNTKEEKLRMAPDEVLAMAIRDMMKKDRK